MNYVLLALMGGLFTFFVTSLGSMVVFFFRKDNKNILDLMLGLSAGIMLAASFFSLLEPALNLAKSLNMNYLLIAVVGILSGGLLLYITDLIFPEKDNKKALKIVGSIAIHNIPEGLAIGVAFGSIKYGIKGATITSALLLTLGIALQNFPEGSAVSLPLVREGYSRKKAFIIGSLTALVEPISSVLGALLVLKVRNILPFCLAFASGAMLYVINGELVPESANSKNKSLITFSTIVGFIIMMILDIALG